MVMKDYARFVDRLFAKKSRGADGLMHAAAGMAGEAGEVLDLIKKHWVYDKPLDREKLIEELGDELFYYVAMLNLLGVNLDAVIQYNMAKLTKRYPDGYTDEAAIARADQRPVRSGSGLEF